MTETFDEPIYWLGRVVNLIVNAGLTINRQKSESNCREVQYLGYMVNQSVFHADPEKVKPVTNHAVPNKGLRF